ncbi:ABC transporter permease [Paenibacillus sp. URB8-2]|uniref:ABC transporter permease n=1 Tax=Paenibacillus sp. URB8-2 TaxID=2741301 RepID=UPI0015B7E1F8|nr:ABC transporter permease [Paenibacillus sp. URB8-2]BCG61641.1 ABC transporter permease [Paenibacillus sp. URB8-2]
MLKRLPAYWILLTPGLLIFLLMFVLPLGRLFVLSFYRTTSSGGMESAFVWDQYIKFLTDPFYLKILWRTLLIGAAVSLICLILGYCLAYGVSRSAPRRKPLLLIMIALPLLTSAVIRNFGWIIILGRKGILNNLLLESGLIKEPLSLMYTSTGVIIALVHVMLPYMVLVLYSVLEGMDRNLEKAAANLGASKWKVFWFVSVPLSMPGILAGTLLVFSITLSFFITPSLIGGSKVKLMATEIYDQTINLLNWPYASALGVILLVTVLIVTNLYNRALSRNKSERANLI